jgi:hypothetical protein
MAVTPTTWSHRWLLWNSLAWLTGFVVYTPIAHGVTGAHPDGLAPRQIVAHSIAVAVVGVIVVGAQRRALAPFVSVPWRRILIAAVAFNIGYWIGSYLPVDWDTDILLGFFALGSAAWVGIVPTDGHRLSAAVALLGAGSGVLGGWMSGVALARMLPALSGMAAAEPALAADAVAPRG